MIKLKDTAPAINVRILMNKHNLTLAQFAKRVGVGHSVMKNIYIENSKPRVETLIKMSGAFNVTLDWLCTEREICDNTILA